MKAQHELHQDQVDYWNGEAGGRWAEEQTRIDKVLAPVIDVLFGRADVRPGQVVLDVGCGCGATSIELARRVGPAGRVVGLDVSAPMLERARHLSAAFKNVEYILADAARHAFPAPFAERLVSRFGVMFFGDPAAAFANLRRALKPGGRVTFACWRPITENPWMQMPLHAAYEHVPRLPKPDPEEPGPFSFADPDRVTRILTAAGFAKPSFTPVDLALDISAGGGLEGAVYQALAIGPATRALADQPEAVRAKVADSVRAALKPLAKGDTVPLGGAIWLVETE